MFRRCDTKAKIITETLEKLGETLFWYLKTNSTWRPRRKYGGRHNRWGYYPVLMLFFRMSLDYNFVPVGGLIRVAAT